MQRNTARRLHQATSLAYWLGNPEWDTGNPIANALIMPVKPVARRAHGFLLDHFYDTEKVLAVSSESVVAASDDNPDEVDKFMFRYPGVMSLQGFEALAKIDIADVKSCLGDTALATEVKIKKAFVFRDPDTHVEAVTQVQPKVNLGIYQELDLEAIQERFVRSSAVSKTTVKGIEDLVIGTRKLIDTTGKYPDIVRSGGNVRRSEIDGSVVLIDVMPVYADGTRLIGDKPPGVINSIIRNLARYEAFVGEFGA